MLTLPIKKKWFNMILSGEKKEEYREIKPYWEKRFVKIFGEIAFVPRPHFVAPVLESPIKEVMFQNGYSKNSPRFVAKCTLSAGTGKEEWGAEKDKQYFILKIHDIKKESEVNMDWKLITRLMNCFPGSFINQEGEFVAHAEANQYFILRDCKSESDIKCKLVEWFSRPAFKTSPFNSNGKNNKFHKFMRSGINQFLGTNFTKKDMEQIYTYFGNACNHEKTVQFVENGYDMESLKESGLERMEVQNEKENR